MVEPAKRERLTGNLQQVYEGGLQEVGQVGWQREQEKASRDVTRSETVPLLADDIGTWELGEAVDPIDCLQ